MNNHLINRPSSSRMISFVRLKHCQIQIDIPLTGLNFPRLYSHGLNLERPKFDARQSPLMPFESRLPSIPVDFPSSDGQVRSSLSDERTCDECRRSLSDECQCFYLKTLEWSEEQLLSNVWKRTSSANLVVHNQTSTNWFIYFGKSRSYSKSE